MSVKQLEIKNLSIEYSSDEGGTVKAVNDMSIEIAR